MRPSEKLAQFQVAIKVLTEVKTPVSREAMTEATLVESNVPGYMRVEVLKTGETGLAWIVNIFSISDRLLDAAERDASSRG